MIAFRSVFQGVFVPGLLAALVCAQTPAALAEEERNFILENRSGSHICYVYLAPQETENWEEGFPGEDCLAPGESVRITFNAGSRGTLWKLRVEDADNEYEEYRGFDFSRLSKITILGAGRATPEP